MNSMWKQFQSLVRQISLFQKPQSNIHVWPAPASRPLVFVLHPQVTNTQHSGGLSASRLADEDGE